jgi:hypothetical protein
VVADPPAEPGAARAPIQTKTPLDGGGRRGASLRTSTFKRETRDFDAYFPQLSPHSQPSQPQFSQLQSVHLPSAQPQSSHLQSSPQQQAAVLATSVVPVAVAVRPRALVARAATAVNKNLDMIEISNVMRGMGLAFDTKN